MNKKIVPEIIILILVFITWTSAEHNYCCADKGPIVNRRCSNGERTWSKSCPSGAYILQNDQYTLGENDTIYIRDQENIINKDRYCLGSIENKNETIAVICFNEIKPVDIKINHPMFPIQICCTITITCLVLTLIVYIILPSLRDLQGKCIMTTIINLIFAFSILFELQESSHANNYSLCLFLAASMYFGFLSAFFWINIVAINIWRTTVKPHILLNKKYIFTCYNIYGWGCPIIMLIIALINHHVPGDHIKPGWTEYSCWFTGVSLVYYFHIPIFVIMTINIVIFISVGWTMWKDERNNSQPTNFRIQKSRKYKCILYLKLFIIMGISWVFEPISVIFENVVISYYIWVITDYVNALQGVLIFLVLVVFRKRVRRDLARKGGMLCGKLPKDWALIPDEEMEELEDSVDGEEPVNQNNVPINQPF